MSIAAYKRTISDTESPRQIERRILSGVTATLETHQAEFDSAEGNGDKLGILAGGLRDALWRNEQIWMTLRNDLAENGNALPPDLRAGLISIALWVERQTQSVMGATGKVKPLVDINRNIIRGLEGSQLGVME